MTCSRPPKWKPC